MTNKKQANILRLWWRHRKDYVSRKTTTSEKQRNYKRKFHFLELQTNKDKKGRKEKNLPICSNINFQIILSIYITLVRQINPSILFKLTFPFRFFPFSEQKTTRMRNKHKKDSTLSIFFSFASLFLSFEESSQMKENAEGKFIAIFSLFLFDFVFLLSLCLVQIQINFKIN